MPMTGNPAVDRSESNVVMTLRKRITFNNPGSGVALTVGVLPPGALVVGGGITVLTAFNSSGADLMGVGVTGSAAAYASAVDVAVQGFKPLDDLALAPAVTAGFSATSELTVTATWTQSVADATAGVADVSVQFITRPVT